MPSEDEFCTMVEHNLMVVLSILVKVLFCLTTIIGTFLGVVFGIVALSLYGTARALCYCYSSLLVFIGAMQARKSRASV